MAGLVKRKANPGTSKTDCTAVRKSSAQENESIKFHPLSNYL